MAATIGHIEAFDENSEQWTTYIERFEHFLEANGIESGKKAAVLLSVIGCKAYGLLRRLVAPETPGEKSFNEIKTLLQQHFTRKPLIIAERFRFHKRNQGVGETVYQYVEVLKKLSEHCEFGEQLEDALRDRFVCGLRSEATQTRLLTEANLTFKKAVQIAASMESQQLSGSLKNSTGMNDHYMESSDNKAEEVSKLPPVLANLMGSMVSSNSSSQPQDNAAPSNNQAVNVQELLSSIMGAQDSNLSIEELLQQPDFSDKINQLLGSLQQNQNQNQNQLVDVPPMIPSLLHLSPGMAMNNMNMHMPMNGGYPQNEPACGPWGRGRGGMQGFRRLGDMSKRPVCRHFMTKGRCRYECDCKFYHPGLNGPPLPP